MNGCLNLFCHPKLSLLCSVPPPLLPVTLQMTAPVMSVVTATQESVSVTECAVKTVTAVLDLHVTTIVVCQNVSLKNAAVTVIVHHFPLTNTVHQTMSADASMIAVTMMIAVAASSVLMNLDADMASA